MYYPPRERINSLDESVDQTRIYTTQLLFSKEPLRTLAMLIVCQYCSKVNRIDAQHLQPLVVCPVARRRPETFT